MRHLACAMTAGLSLTVAVGCASNNHPPKARAPLTSITRSRAHSLASLLTIRQADLPEFKVRADAIGAERDDPRLARCARERQAASSAESSGRRVRVARAGRSSAGKPPPPRAWAKARSERLSANGGYQTLRADSAVSIMPTVTAARSEIAAMKNTNFACIEHVLVADGSHKRFGVRGVTIEPLHMTVKGADASVAYRAVVAYRHVPLVLYVDSIVFAYGQDAFTLTTFHASKPVPLAMNERLLGLLIARGRSHSR